MCVYVQKYWYDSTVLQLGGMVEGGVDEYNEQAHRFYAVVLFELPLQPSAT
jgi:hypothetical protein